jgi:hypothetical protein
MLAQPQTAQHLPTTHTSLLSQDQTMASLGKLANANAQDLERLGWQELVHRAEGPPTWPQTSRLSHIRRGDCCTTCNAEALQYRSPRRPGPSPRPDWRGIRCRKPRPSTDGCRAFVGRRNDPTSVSKATGLSFPTTPCAHWDNLRAPLGRGTQTGKATAVNSGLRLFRVLTRLHYGVPAERHAVRPNPPTESWLRVVQLGPPGFRPPKSRRAGHSGRLLQGGFKRERHPKTCSCFATGPRRHPTGRPAAGSPHMGWVESPPYFTSLTETACDLVNAAVKGRIIPKPLHRLETLSQTPPAAGTQQLVHHDHGVLPYGWKKTNSTLLHHAHPTLVGTRTPSRPPMSRRRFYLSSPRPSAGEPGSCAKHYMPSRPSCGPSSPMTRQHEKNPSPSKNYGRGMPIGLTKNKFWVGSLTL